MDFWTIAALPVALGIALYFIFRRQKTLHSFAPIGRVEVLRGSTQDSAIRYQVAARIFSGRLQSGTHVWRSLGVFENLDDAVRALREYQAPRATESNTFVFVDGGRLDVRLLTMPRGDT